MQMPNMNPMGFLSQMLMQNPNLQGNPQIQNLQQMVQAGDSNGVQQMCNNLCEAYGVKAEDVFNQVKPKLNLPFL